MDQEHFGRRKDRRPAERAKTDDIPCDELGPDDGIDPRVLFKNEYREYSNDHGRRQANHKTDQLCAQAARALRYALAGTCRDTILQDLDVEGVEPAPDVRRLRAIVRPRDSAVGTAEIRARLAIAHGLLRTAVAEEINRRKAPELVFRVVPHDEVPA